MPAAEPGGDTEPSHRPPRSAKTIYSLEQEMLVSLLREARERAGLSQNALAESLGRSEDYVWRLERGQQRLELLVWLRYLAACQADPIGFLRRLVEANVFEPPFKLDLPPASRTRRRRRR